RAVRAHDRDLLRPRAAWIHGRQGPALPAATRAMCARVQRRARAPFAAAGAATHDLCCASTDRALARLSRHVPAVLAHRAGAQDVAPASKSAMSDNFIQGGRLCSSVRPCFKDFPQLADPFTGWVGLTPDDAPLLMR